MNLPSIYPCLLTISESRKLFPYIVRFRGNSMHSSKSVPPEKAVNGPGAKAEPATSPPRAQW